MADASAAALAELLLAGDASRPDESLAAALAGDPPLVLWTVCVAGGRHDFEPHGIDDVARWLARHPLKVLQWEPDQDFQPEETGGIEAEVYADRVAAGLQVADLAARLAAEEGKLTAEPAFLMGLLSDASEWLAVVGNLQADDASTCLPGWLTTLDEIPGAGWAKLAKGVLAGEASLPQSAQIDLDACRSRAAEGRRRWLAPARGIGDRLPVLARKLARLATLESDFQHTVETERLEAMAEFAAGAGHEINNPLTVIAGRAQLFLREEKDPERRRALALISAQAKRVYEMIADMMLFARPPKPKPEMIDLVELVDRLVEEFSLHAARQETTLCRAGDGGPMEIEADPTQLTVALRGMCQNSLEAIGRQGRIEIGLYRRQSGVEIRVTDDGPGIPPEQRRHLFDAYYSARQAGRGLGLGLSKAWRIITNHGGRIDVDSQPGHGAVFTITLPPRQL